MTPYERFAYLFESYMLSVIPPRELLQAWKQYKESLNDATR